MGTLNNQQLQEELLSNLGNRDDFSVALGSRLERALAFSQDRIARRYRFEELNKLSTANLVFNNNNDDKFLSTPTNLRTNYSLRLIDGTLSRRLDWVDPREWDRVLPFPPNTARGRPERYTYFRDVFELHPLPNKVYAMELRWDAWPAAFTSLGQSSDFLHKDDVILHGATAYLYDSLDQTEKARKFATIFLRLLEEAVNTEKDDSHKEIKPLFELDSPVGDYWRDPFIRSMNI